MSKRPSLNFDISVSAAKRKAAKKRAMTGEVGASHKQCEWPDCAHTGSYRAPKSRDKIGEFRWFCLDHVREYNSRWNFYENMTDEEVSKSMENDRLWGRQTWKMGKPPEGTATNPHEDGQAWRRFGLEDPLEILGDKGTINPGDNIEAKRARARLLPRSIRKALNVMQLDALATKSDIRNAYKELVKRYHPDQNGGDRSEEARLREVLWAWDQLKKSDAFAE
jgi:hypothetical protein